MTRDTLAALEDLGRYERYGMRTLRLTATVFLAFALALVFSASALGASATSTSASASASTPVDAAAGGPVDFQIWPGQAGKTAMITVVEVDAKTKLPVTVRVPVAPGATVEWAGEIMGGPAESDIQRPYKLVQGQGGQFAELTLTTSHRGQVDAVGFPLKVSKDLATVSVEWVQSVSSPLTTTSVRIPAGVSKVKISPKPEGDPVKNVDGELLYTLKSQSYKPGEKQTIEISYSTIPPVEPAPGSELTPVLIGLGIALVIAVIAVVILVRRQSTGVQTSGDDDGDDQEEPTGGAMRPSDSVGDDDEPDLDFD